MQWGTFIIQQMYAKTTKTKAGLIFYLNPLDVGCSTGLAKRHFNQRAK